MQDSIWSILPIYAYFAYADLGQLGYETQTPYATNSANFLVFGAATHLGPDCRIWKYMSLAAKQVHLILLSLHLNWH